MTNTQLQSTIAEAIQLDRQRAYIEARLAELRESLITEAQSRTDEHTPTDAGGWSWTAADTDGNLARVTQDGPSLKASISTEKDIAKAEALAGPAFDDLFQPKACYKLAPGFRALAEQHLGKAAGKLIKAFTQPGKIKLSYETKEAA